MSVILVGDNGLLLEGLRSVLTSNRLPVVAVLSSTADLPAVQVMDGPLLAIIDCANDGSSHAATSTAARVRHLHPRALICILAGSEQGNLAQIASTVAPNAIVSRDISTSTLVKLIEFVCEGVSVVPIGLLHQIGIRTPSGPPPSSSTPDVDLAPTALRGDRLSDREIDILRCLMNGKSNKCIARQLSIAEGTVKVTVKGVLRKISAANRTQAAIWGLKHLDEHGERDGRRKVPAATEPFLANDRSDVRTSGVDGDAVDRRVAF